MDPEKEENKQAEAQPQPPPSFIIFQFAGIGSSEFSFHPNNVTPLQVGAVANWLNWYVQNQFDEIENQRKLEAIRKQASSPKIIVPQAHFGREPLN